MTGTGSERTFQVRQYRSVGCGTGVQIACNLTLTEASVVVASLTEYQDEHGGNREYTILPD